MARAAYADLLDAIGHNRSGTLLRLRAGGGALADVGTRADRSDPLGRRSRFDRVRVAVVGGPA